MLVVLPMLLTALFLTLFLYLLLRGASCGTDREAEAEEQMRYLKTYQARRKPRL